MTGPIITTTATVLSRDAGPGAIPQAETLRELTTLALWLGGGALLLSVLLPFVIKPLLQRWGVIDIPSDRSSHDRPNTCANTSRAWFMSSWRLQKP